MGKRRRRNHSETPQEKKKREWMRDVEKSLERETLKNDWDNRMYIVNSHLFSAAAMASEHQEAKAQPRSFWLICITIEHAGRLVL